MFSYEQLLLDCENYDMLRVTTEGFSTSAEMLGPWAIEEIGPQEHFLLDDHTKAHLREIWQPRLMERHGSWEEWAALGRPGPLK